MDLSNIDYFHGCISRAVAEDLLSDQPFGSFLLRKSLKDNDTYVISVASLGKVLHYSIVKSEHTNLYSVSHGSEHITPVLVCEHYMHGSNGLKTKLLYPVLNTHICRSTNHSASRSARPLSVSYEEFEWFHGNISRDEDTRRLSNAYFLNKQNGMFLVRQKSDFKYVLSVVFLEKVHRYIINHDPETNYFYLDDKQKSLKFNSLEALLDFHRDHAPEVTGLKCCLSLPCRRSTNVTDDMIDSGRAKRLSSSASNVGRTVKKVAIDLAKELTAILPANSVDADWSDAPIKYENHLTSSLSRHSTLRRFSKKSMPKDSIGFYSPYRNFTGTPGQDVPIVPDLYIDRSQLHLMDELGSGHFGSVRLAECNIVGRNIPCAVKILCGNDVQANRTELLKEAAIMQHLDHPFIVRLLAVCDPETEEDRLMIVLELAPLGSLKAFIKKKNEDSFPENKILMLMQQVCDGMAYLAHHNVVHRDLAARNILMVTENFVKISDFGMSRILQNSDYYKASKPGCWPLRWYAPEALHYYKFTTKGDVWSYGITLWEVCSYGNRPYKGMSGREVLNMLECEKKRLECPAGCSPGLYSLMLQCWAYEPENRPTFEDLLIQFDKLILE